MILLSEGLSKTASIFSTCLGRPQKEVVTVGNLFTRPDLLIRQNFYSGEERNEWRNRSRDQVSTFCQQISQTHIGFEDKQLPSDYWYRINVSVALVVKVLLVGMAWFWWVLVSRRRRFSGGGRGGGSCGGRCWSGGHDRLSGGGCGGF